MMDFEIYLFFSVSLLLLREFWNLFLFLHIIVVVGEEWNLNSIAVAIQEASLTWIIDFKNQFEFELLNLKLHN